MILKCYCVTIKTSANYFGKIFNGINYTIRNEFIHFITNLHYVRFKKWRIYYILHIYDFYLLTLPNRALVLASLLMTIIMRYTNIAKNKDRGNIFIGIVSILFIVGINVFMQWRNKSAFSGDGAAEYLVNNQSSLLVQMTNYFPTTYFGAVALVENAN